MLEGTRAERRNLHGLGANMKAWRRFHISIYIEHCSPLGASCLTSYLSVVLDYIQ